MDHRSKSPSIQPLKGQELNVATAVKLEIPEVPEKAPEKVQITAPKIRTLRVRIKGTAPFVQLRFSEKAQKAMLDKQLNPVAKKRGGQREAKNPDELFEGAMYRTVDGEYGIPASSFRNAMIRACSLVGYKMTQAKMSIFIKADGVDAFDGTPLVFINGTPEPVMHPVRNATGVADIRVRAMWREWEADLVIEYDADQFQEEDVANLLLRAGIQVGVGEGRPSSKNSAGMGWGTFVSVK